MIMQAISRRKGGQRGTLISILSMINLHVQEKIITVLIARTSKKQWDGANTRTLWQIILDKIKAIVNTSILGQHDI
jgi:hypothetical protein